VLRRGGSRTELDARFRAFPLENEREIGYGWRRFSMDPVGRHSVMRKKSPWGSCAAKRVGGSLFSFSLVGRGGFSSRIGNIPTARPPAGRESNARPLRSSGGAKGTRGVGWSLGPPVALAHRSPLSSLRDFDQGSRDFRPTGFSIHPLISPSSCETHPLKPNPIRP